MLPVLFYIPQVWSLIAVYAQQLLTLSSVPFLQNRKFGFLWASMHHFQSFNFLIAVMNRLCNIRTCMVHEDHVEWVSLHSSWIKSSLLPLTWEWMVQLVGESLGEFSVILCNFAFFTFLFLKSNSSGDLGYTIFFRFKSIADYVRNKL